MCYEEEYPIEDRCCGDDCADIIAVNSVSLRMASGATTVWAGTDGTIYATVCPSNATCQTLTWTSSNTSVLSCSGGSFTAHSAGSAVVRAYAKTVCTARLSSRYEPFRVRLRYPRILYA